MEYDSNDLVAIRGLVVPSKWGKSGDVTGIAIAGFDENEYPVLMDQIGRRLMALMHEEVFITGRAVKIDKRDVIKVKKFHKNLVG